MSVVIKKLKGPNHIQSYVYKKVDTCLPEYRNMRYPLKYHLDVSLNEIWEESKNDKDQRFIKQYSLHKEEDFIDGQFEFIIEKTTN